VRIDLLMNSHRFTAGDRFLLRMLVANTCGSTVFVVDEYVVLDLFGSYWFWPDWGGAVNGRYGVALEPAGQTVETLLDFRWPPGVGALDGILFWGALTEQGSFDLLSLDGERWGCY